MSTNLTLTGHGGISGPIRGFSASPCWFVDNTGGIPFSQLAQYNLAEPPHIFGGNTGSFLLSSPFHLKQHETLHISLTFLTLEFPHYDFGAAYLLSNNKVVATLYSAWGGPEGVSVLNSVPITPGVTLNPAGALFQGNQVILGGITYGPDRFQSGVPGPHVPGGSLPWVTSSYTPGEGDYQLLFIAYNTVDNAGGATALAIGSIQPKEAEPVHA